MNKSICIIPARGGSKRFPGKNLSVIGKKTLVRRSIDLAINTNIFDKILLTSDDEKILDEAIDELKKDDFKDLDLDKNKFSKKTNLIFETDLELMFPNDFINSSQERLNLYTRLNKIISFDIFRIKITKKE